MRHIALFVATLALGTACKPHAAFDGSETASPPGGTASAYNSEGYRALPRMTAGVSADNELYDALSNDLGINLNGMCGQIVEKEGDPEGIAHFLWGRKACRNMRDVIPYEEVDFDFRVVYINPVESLERDQPLPESNGLAALLRAFGHGETRVGFIYEISEPRQPIGYWMEKGKTATRPGTATLHGFCTSHSILIQFQAAYRFAETCSLNVDKEKKALTSVTFKNPTPVRRESIHLPQDEVTRIRSGERAGYYADFDRSANTQVRPSTSYQATAPLERVARAQEVVARFRLLSGDAPGYFESQRNADLLRLDTREAARNELLRGFTQELMRRR